MKKDLISVVMPVRNGEAYIREAIQSVLLQSYEKWELLIVNNGSSDGTKGIVSSFRDPRIQLYEENQHIGIGYARNRAMREMSGEFFCFLDSDDKLPPDSLSKRLEVFRADSSVHFVDGWVETWDKNFDHLKEVCKPSYRGNPLAEVVSLSARCVCAISWMVRRIPGHEYRFVEGWTHAEDLAFYIGIAGEGIYDYVESPVYRVRRGHTSVMSDLDGLCNGYQRILEYMTKISGVSAGAVDLARQKMRRIMTCSYLKTGRLLKAYKSWRLFGPVR